MLQRLPLGVQDFEDIRKKNYLYVDKTEKDFQNIIYLMAVNMGALVQVER